MESESFVLAAGRGRLNDLTGQLLYVTPAFDGVISAGAGYFNAGDTTLYTADEEPATINLQQDFVGALSYARPLTPSSTAGCTVKWLHSAMFERFTAQTMAVDIGAQGAANDALRAAVVVRNIGAKIAYDEEESDLPLAACFGLSLDARDADTRAGVTLLGELEKESGHNGLILHYGLEVHAGRAFMLRGGVRVTSEEAPKVYSAGFGIAFRSFRLDYAMRVGGLGVNPQTLGLTVSPGRAKENDSSGS